MPNSNEIRADMNNSSVLSTSRSTTTVPLSKFNAEMNAKNTAYFFILSNNLMKQFMQFCKNYNSTDPHGDCVEYLLTTLSKENKL